LAALSSDKKLKCIDQVLTGKMPKGKALSDPDAVGKLIGEFSGGGAVPPTPDE
jgi:hypothetical protein